MAAGEKYLTYSDAIDEMATKINSLELGDAYYHPLGSDDTYLSIFNSDGTYAPEGMSTGAGSIAVTFGSKGVQMQHSVNNWYPSMIAGRQYANMTTNNVLPVYYSQYVSTNPGAGKVKAKDFILVINGTEYSLADYIRNL